MIKIMRFLKPYRLLLVLVLVLAVGQATANLYLPNLMADIVDNGIVKADTGYIWRTGGLMALVAIGGTLCAVVGIFFSSQVATGMGKIIRAQIFYKVQRFSLHEFDTVSTASLITRTTNDTTQVQQVMVMVLNMLITAPITLVVGIILALNQDVGLSWILVAIMPVLVIIILILLSKAIPLFTRMQAKLDKLNLILDEGLTGVRVVRAFDRVKSEEAALRPGQRRRDRCGHQSEPAHRRPDADHDAGAQLFQCGYHLVWRPPVNSGDMQMGSLLAFLQYAMLILFAMLMVSMMFIMLPRAEASAPEINQVLAMKPEIKDAEQVKDAHRAQGLVGVPGCDV